MTYPVVNEDENPFAQIVSGQTIVEVPEFELESGEIITKVPIAYKTWGKLNDEGTNCMIITHALTGSADVADWWGPLLGKDKAFDPTRFFIICLNSLGSPYGSASPLTMDHEYGERYGPEFPLSTIRDDVRIHRMILDSLGVKQVAICIGGSMGGMLTLEWMFQDDGQYVRHAVALATSARHSAWCISWGEAQRQCIYSDPKYDDGYYSLDDPPVAGLGAARMSALLTYRSRNSFESRFGREAPSARQRLKSTLGHDEPDSAIDENHDDTHDENHDDSKVISVREREENWAIHNEGANRKKSFESYHTTEHSRSNSMDSTSTDVTTVSSTTRNHRRVPRHYFSAQSYLRYQAQKFVTRFDANCYISITRKLDTHDVGRDRPEYDNDARKALQSRQQPTLVIGIQSDALFTLSEQIFIAKNLPNSEIKKINSPEGHDAFLLEFDDINRMILNFEHKQLPEIFDSERLCDYAGTEDKKESVFGEQEDVANW